MPDLDPMALSRSSTSPTPSQSSKSQNLQTQNVCRSVKQGVGPPPPRINLEPLYMALKGAVGEHWGEYKEAISKFLSGACDEALEVIGSIVYILITLIGNLNQAELSAYIDPIIVTPTGEKERLHNKLISGIYGNAIRELPDQDVAIWVSRNDKPLTTTPKPVTGDAAEQRLKLDVMQLPNKARQRIKNLTQNDVCIKSNYNLNTNHFSRTSRWTFIPISLVRTGGLKLLQKYQNLFRPVLVEVFK